MDFKHVILKICISFKNATSLTVILSNLKMQSYDHKLRSYDVTYPVA